MEDYERAGLLAGVAGVAALGGRAAIGAARNAARKSVVGRPDPYHGIDLTAMYDLPASTVTTDDGLELAVRTLIWGTSPTVRCPS